MKTLETIDNGHLFDLLVEKNFGRLTMNAWQVAPNANDFEEVVKPTFFYDRKKYHSDIPINKKAANCIFTLYDYAMSDMTRFDSIIISNNLIDTLEEIGGFPLSSFRFVRLENNTSRGSKIAALLDLLWALLRLIADKQSVDSNSVQSTFWHCLEMNEKGAYKTALMGNPRLPHCGVINCFYNVSEINFDNWFSNTTHTVDVILVDGFAWTNENRKSIIELMRNPQVAVRIGLLNPRSAFFAPYSEISNYTSDDLSKRISDTLDMWKSMHQQLLRTFSKACSLELSLHTGFPAKELYRFDDSIIVTQASNVFPIGQSISFECVRNRSLSRSAFDVYEQEINWLLFHSENQLKSEAVGR